MLTKVFFLNIGLESGNFETRVHGAIKAALHQSVTCNSLEEIRKAKMQLPRCYSHLNPDRKIES